MFFDCYIRFLISADDIIDFTLVKELISGLLLFLNSVLKMLLHLRFGFDLSLRFMPLFLSHSAGYFFRVFVST